MLMLNYDSINVFMSLKSTHVHVNFDCLCMPMALDSKHSHSAASMAPD